MEAAESPLDVLSRAATMVQDNNAAGYGEEVRGCPTKELPTTRWRRERRCRERLGEYRSMAPASTKVDRPEASPLDMSTRGRTTRPPPPYSARPSVITCAPPATGRRETLSGMCDPVIDEHFRRSLGNDYMSLFSDNANNNNNNNNNGDNGITVTGLSVDDHFAKALGETWIQLQTKSAASEKALSQTNGTSKDTTPVPVTAASTGAGTASLVQQRHGLLSI